MYVRPKLTFVSFFMFFCTLPLTGPSKIFLSTRKNKVTAELNETISSCSIVNAPSVTKLLAS